MVAKVEHHQGELFPRVGFIVTNLSSPSRSVVRFYNKGGTAEQWIKEGKQAAREGTISRRRNNRKRLGDNHWVRKAKMEIPGKNLHSTALCSVCPNFVAAFWLAVVVWGAFS